MGKPDIKVVIIADSKGEKCDTDCGVDWSSAEAITLARQRIRERFGDRVQLDYIDLSGPGRDRVLELNQRIRDMPLPLLVLNGESRISGQFDVRLLLDAIEAEIEIKQ